MLNFPQCTKFLSLSGPSRYDTSKVWADRTLCAHQGASGDLWSPSRLQIQHYGGVHRRTLRLPACTGPLCKCLLFTFRVQIVHKKADCMWLDYKELIFEHLSSNDDANCVLLSLYRWRISCSTTWNETSCPASSTFSCRIYLTAKIVK